jgi:hypothetical protein
MRRLFLAIALAACSGVEARAGLGEPLRIPQAAFKEGALPSTPGAKPEVTAIETASTLVRSRQSGKSIGGRTSPEAVAVAIAFADLGTGYWVFPVGGPDPANGGELEWNATVDFGANLPIGKHDLAVVAIDGAGHPGALRTLGVCVPSETPDNLAACDPTAKLPATVISLTWDSPVDLDLVVAAPDGSVVSSKRPKLGGTDAGAWAIDRDSNSGCVFDGIQREDLVFPEAPPPGSYLIYANLFSACGRAPVHFHVAVTQAGNVTLTREGTLLAVGANGGAALGTFVTEVAFQ